MNTYRFGIMRDETIKRRDLNVSLTLGYEGRKYNKSSSGTCGHTGGTRPGQTRNKPEDLSVREREERGRGKGGGGYGRYGVGVYRREVNHEMLHTKTQMSILL